jgi:hypothetical protein
MAVAAKWEWEQYLEPVRGELGGGGDGGDGGGKVATAPVLSFDAYLAARSVVTSRAFAVDERHSNGFVPFADLFNHVTGSAHVQFADVGMLPGPSDIAEVDAAGLGVDAADPSDWAEVGATRAAAAGDEMYNSYGHLCNGALLASFGFTHDGNPADSVTLSAAALRAAVAVAGGVQGGALARQSRWCMQAGLLGPPRHAARPHQCRQSLTHSEALHAHTASGFVSARRNLVPTDPISVLTVVSPRIVGRSDEPGFRLLRGAALPERMLLYMHALLSPPSALANALPTVGEYTVDADPPRAEPTQHTVDAIYALARCTTGDEGDAGAHGTADREDAASVRQSSLLSEGVVEAVEAALAKRAAVYGGGTLEEDCAELAALRARCSGEGMVPEEAAAREECEGRGEGREHVLRIRISEREILQEACTTLQQARERHSWWRREGVGECDRRTGAAAPVAPPADELWGLFD